MDHSQCQHLLLVRIWIKIKLRLELSMKLWHFLQFCPLREQSNYCTTVRAFSLHDIYNRRFGHSDATQTLSQWILSQTGGWSHTVTETPFIPPEWSLTKTSDQLGKIKKSEVCHSWAHTSFCGAKLHLKLLLLYMTSFLLIKNSWHT